MKNLNPYFITGICDGESYFYIRISKNSKYKIGWSVDLSFGISLHNKDKALLEKIELYFGIGSITNKGKDLIQYRVSSINKLETIINHFDKYPLTQKCFDYQLWKMAFYLVKDKEHLTLEGVQKIVSIKASMNNGLSDKLKVAFPNIIPVPRPLVLDLTIIDPNWLSGFVSGEACFLLIFRNL